MRLHHRFAVLILSLTIHLGISGPASYADELAFKPGTKIESLTVGPHTYVQVQVRSVSVRTLVITHSGGMASIRLRDLSPEWQARFHYDPVADAAAEHAAKIAPPPPAPTRPKAPASEPPVSRLKTLLRQFGQPAIVRAEVDLRPKFFQLELGVKSQGLRPSCAIFAIVSALEFQNAEAIGRVEKFSEEYLSWAVRKTIQRPPRPISDNPGEKPGKEDSDDGFSLSEVVAALRTYGVPLQSSMPNTFGLKIGAIEEPPPAVVAEARDHQKVFVHLLPGRDGPTRLNNLIHSLNAGVPVAIGLAWPNYRSIRTGYLSNQKPMTNAGHAVTLVGYRCPTGRVEDTVFIFKNSWGSEWGQGGYGIVTYGYLDKYVYEAVLLEVQRNQPA